MSKQRIRQIIKEEAERAGFSYGDLLASNNMKRVTFVRHYAMWRARNETGRSWAEIGSIFERDHSTVMHGFKKIEAMSPDERASLPTQTVPVRRGRFKAQLFKGHPCKHGHVGFRYLNSGKCVTCEALRSKKQYAKKKGGGDE